MSMQTFVHRQIPRPMMSSTSSSVQTYSYITELTTALTTTTRNATQPELPYSTSMSGFIIAITALITLACILGNLLVILAVLLVHKLKTPSNYLIVSLAVSDWFVGLIVMPPSIVYQVLGYWPFGNIVCTIWVTFDVYLCSASILNLMMISVDRYLVITRPFRYSQHRTVKLMVVYMTIAWLVSLAISTTPLIIGWVPEVGDGTLCMVSQEVGYQIYATLGAFYIPLTIMIAVYGKIFFISRKLSKAEHKNSPHPISNQETPAKQRLDYHMKNGSVDLKIVAPDETIPLDNNENIDHYDGISESSPCHNPKSSLPAINELGVGAAGHPNHNKHRLSVSSISTGNHHEKHSLKKLSIATLTSVKNFLHRRKSTRNSQAIKTLGAIMGLFTACWLPFFILAVVAPICGESCAVPNWIWGALTWLGYVNSCFNPVIYARFNREFRIPFREILCCRCCKINDAVRHTDYLYQYGD